jgi:hypothetical protein
MSVTRKYIRLTVFGLTDVSKTQSGIKSFEHGDILFAITDENMENLQNPVNVPAKRRKKW